MTSVAELSGVRVEWLDEIEARFCQRTPGSLAAFEKHRALLPGGSAGGLGYMHPYPLYIHHGLGSQLWDADENQYTDTFFGDWLLVLGHAHPEVVAAVTEQLGRGSTFGQPTTDLGYEVASLVHERLPSMERLRFTTSGSEATQAALRLARVFTGRDKVAKMRGGYHGTHDVSLIANGRFSDPDSVPPGLIVGTKEHTVLLPFNDADECDRIIEQEAANLAAVIVEPVLGGSGMVPATQDFLTRLRAVTERHGVLLIMDEVVTMPVGPHGAQGIYGIVPDLTTLGKALGGGLPLAAFGGRKEIIDLMDPEISPLADYRHASTLGGSAVPLAASLAQLRLLTPEVLGHMAALGDRLRQGINDLGAKCGVPLQSTGIGHLWSIHWSETPVIDFDTVLTSNRLLMSKLALAVTNEGYFFRASGNGVIAAPMDEAVIDGFLATFSHVLADAGLAS